MRKTFIASVLILAGIPAAAHQPRHIFQQAFEKVEPAAIRADGWCPYPSYHDRKGWDEMLGNRKEAFIKEGERYLGYEWQVIKATDYLAFERTGDRISYQAIDTRNSQALASLTMAELAEGKGRFIDQIINGAWLQTERTTWVMSAHEYRQDTGRALPDSRDVFIDLGCQRWASLLSMDLYFFRDEFDRVDPSITYAIEDAMDRNVFKPYLDPAKRKAQSWLGYPAEDTGKVQYWEAWYPVNNWNTWSNSAVAIAALFALRDHDRMMDILRQAVESIDIYMDTVDLDGGCSEGISYWGHASGCLYDFVRFMNYATQDKFGCWDDPQFRSLMTYVSRGNAADGWSFNFSDCNARSTGSPWKVFCIGRDTGLKEMTDYAAFLALSTGDPAFVNIDPSGYLYESLENVRASEGFSELYRTAVADAGGDLKKAAATLRSDVPQASWYPGTQHFFVRSSSGMQFAAKGGHNEEAHNHNDVGTFTLYADGIPVLIDLGTATYRRQTFSPERYTIWYMRSEWHNLPLINGCPQHEGRSFASTGANADPSKFSFSADIAGAYIKEAACKSWKRSLKLTGTTLDLTDSFQLSSRSAADEEHFITTGAVTLTKPGEMVLDCKSFDGTRNVAITITYPTTLSASVETITLEDRSQIKVWGPEVRRIILKSRDDAPLKGSYKIRIATLMPGTFPLI